MKSWTNKILPALLAGTLTFTYGAAVDAKGNGNGNGKGNEHKGGHVKVEKHLKFKDLDDKHWARTSIELLASKKIINGYADMTFKANKPVTQLEAIVMVMNLLTQEDDDLLTVGEGYKGNLIPSWAKDSVRLALINDVISIDDLKNPNKPASRLFVVKLLVNALGADLDQEGKSNLFFGDIANLTSEEKAYLSFALLETLVKGYEDKTFKPNKPVTRAEMAAFVTNLMNKIGDGDYTWGTRASGTLSAVDADSREITFNSKTYEVSEDAVVKLDNKVSDLDKLEEGMKVQVVIKNDEVVTIYAETEEEADEVTYKVEKVADGKAAIDFKEAVITGEEVDDSTPNLSNDSLTVILNGEEFDVDLDGIDGDETSGTVTAAELEEAIEDALDEYNRIDVTYDADEEHFVFETVNSSTNVKPTLSFEGDALDELGLDEEEAEGTLAQEAVAEAAKIVVTSGAEVDGTLEVSVEDGDIDEVVEVDVEEGDSATEIADKIADALQENGDIDDAYKVTVSGKEVTLTSRDAGENLNLKIEISQD